MQIRGKFLVTLVWEQGHRVLCFPPIFLQNGAENLHSKPRTSQNLSATSINTNICRAARRVKRKMKVFRWQQEWGQCLRRSENTFVITKGSSELAWGVMQSTCRFKDVFKVHFAVLPWQRVFLKENSIKKTLSLCRHQSRQSWCSFPLPNCHSFSSLRSAAPATTRPSGTHKCSEELLQESLTFPQELWECAQLRNFFSKIKDSTNLPEKGGQLCPLAHPATSLSCLWLKISVEEGAVSLFLFMEKDFGQQESVTGHRKWLPTSRGHG